MLIQLGNKAAKALVDCRTIDKSEQGLYGYGFFILFSNVLFLIITAIFGIIAELLFESLIFYLTFVIIRRYAGGYHAKTEVRCLLLSIIIVATSILLIKVSTIYANNIFAFLMTIVSSGVIMALCPVDSKEKPLCEKEKKYYRKISWIVIVIINIFLIIVSVFEFKLVIVPCSVSLFVESILLIFGKIKRINNSNG